MQKRYILPFVCVLLTLLGLCLLLYPTVSNAAYTAATRSRLSAYAHTVEQIGDDHREQLLCDAAAYNEALARQDAIDPEPKADGYTALLDVDGTGLMGSLAIPALDLELPIYHGTDEAVLQSGVGHLQGTSLPIGGASTHAVLSAHSGMRSAKMFTDLDRMQTGDVFSLRILGATLWYEVEDIAVVEPHQIDRLAIRQGEDLCTLVTCTPYGVNDHRLLVRGHRVEMPQTEDDTVIDTTPFPWHWIAVIAAAVAVPLVIVCVWQIGKKRCRS